MVLITDYTNINTSCFKAQIERIERSYLLLSGDLVGGVYKIHISRIGKWMFECGSSKNVGFMCGVKLKGLSYFTIFF